MDASEARRRPAIAGLAGLLLLASESVGFDGPPPTGADGRLTAEARLAAQQRIHPEQAGKLPRPPAHGSTPVPPLLEIAVLDPNVDPLGNPAVIARRSADGSGLAVEIPPVALVHRYYYSGDRSFQGPMLPGGPSILVFNHPRTNERTYLDVMMLPGAPRVTYRRDAIEYDYGPQAIIVSFGLHGRPSVTYRNGVPLLVKARRATAHVGKSAADLVQRTGLPAAGRKAAAGVKNVAETTADRAHDLGKAVASPVVSLVRSTPLASMLTSSAEDRATHARRRRPAGLGRAEGPRQDHPDDPLTQGSRCRSRRCRTSAALSSARAPSLVSKS